MFKVKIYKAFSFRLTGLAKRALPAMFALLLSGATLFAAAPASFSGLPAIDRAKVELFARTMTIAQGKATAATVELRNDANSPEKAASKDEAVKDIKTVLQLGSNIIDAEKKACAETGMSDTDFHEVKIRLLQVLMLQNMEKMKAAMVGKRSGTDMAAEGMAGVDQKLAALEARLAKSREALAKAQSEEAEYFAKQDKKIAEQQSRITKLQSEAASETVAKKREAKTKQLESAREKLVKMQADRQKPYSKLVSARERVEKDEKSVSVFRENMAAAKDQIASMGKEIQDFQNKMETGFAQTQDSDVMKQAALDMPVFLQFPELKPFLIEPKK
ncbi:hypothetical protein MASR1M12_27780 [Erysipelotrichia bacterium]